MREKVVCLPSIWFGNKLICVFLVPAPEMRWFVIEGQGSTNVSLCDREITLRWQKASATSITSTVLPAIIRSLKAIFKWFQKGTVSLPIWFYPDDRPGRDLLVLWFMAKDCTDFIALFPPLLNFSHISCIHLYRLCLLILSWIFHSFNWLLFATWHHIKGGTTTADCNASFIFINQRRDFWVREGVRHSL